MARRERAAGAIAPGAIGTIAVVALAFAAPAIETAALAKRAEPTEPRESPRSGEGRTVIVLGDSRTDGCEGQTIAECRKGDIGFNRPVVARLLGLAARRHPDAVFFTGDLTLGLEREEEDGKIDAGATPATGGWKRDFEYDGAAFARMIRAFRDTATRALGATPFFAVVGNHDAVGADALARFRVAFGLEHPPDAFADPGHLAYVAAVGNAVFVVLATDHYVECGAGAKEPCNLQEHAIGDAQLAWLDEALTKHDGLRLFVLGHEPAFSAGGARVGLDHDGAARDRFWAVLEKHHVVAYLTSHQHRFDVSQHRGVWQIVSGGAGAPLDGRVKTDEPDRAPGGEHHAGSRDHGPVEADACTGGLAIRARDRETSFFHYVTLTLPDDPARPVVAEVRDCADRARARLPLAVDAPPTAP